MSRKKFYIWCASICILFLALDGRFGKEIFFLAGTGLFDMHSAFLLNLATTSTISALVFAAYYFVNKRRSDWLKRERLVLALILVPASVYSFYRGCQNWQKPFLNGVIHRLEIAAAPQKWESWFTNELQSRGLESSGYIENTPKVFSEAYPHNRMIALWMRSSNQENNYVSIMWRGGRHAWGALYDEHPETGADSEGAFRMHWTNDLIVYLDFE